MLSVMSSASSTAGSPTTPSKMGLGFLLNNKDLSKKRPKSASSCRSVRQSVAAPSCADFSENANPGASSSVATSVASNSLANTHQYVKRRSSSTTYTTSATAISLPPLNTSARSTPPNLEPVSAVSSRYSPIPVDYPYKVASATALPPQQYMPYHPQAADSVYPLHHLPPSVAASVAAHPPSTCFSSPIQQSLPDIAKTTSNLPSMHAVPVGHQQMYHHQPLPALAHAPPPYEQQRIQHQPVYPQYYEQHPFANSQQQPIAVQPPQSAPSYYYYPDNHVQMSSPSAIIHHQPVQEYATGPTTTSNVLVSASVATAVSMPTNSATSGKISGSKSSKKSNNKLSDREERKKRLQMALQDLNNGYFKNIHSAASTYEVNYNSLKNAYYKINGKDENSQRLTTEEREIRIKRAIKGFQEGKYANLTVASKFEKVCAETVRNRYHGRTQSFSVAKRNR